jgi:diguanylate cyclase (GGDEF)-like protein
VGNRARNAEVLYTGVRAVTPFYLTAVTGAAVWTANSMKQILGEFTRWYESRRFGVAVCLSALLLSLLVTIDGLLGFEPAFRILYVLPLWFATRLGGRWAGAILVGLGTWVGTTIDLQSRQPTQVTVLAGVLSHFVAFGLMMLIIARLEEALWSARKQALRDPLTGLLNRRALKEFGGDAFTRAKSLNEPLTAVVIDCNDFKKLNDEFGHLAGDHTLQLLAKALESETRQMDLIARIGGDEFVILLPGSDEEEARGVMARVERSFDARVRDAGYTTSLSVGLAAAIDGDKFFDNLLHRADGKMYSEKARNKNRAYLN